MAQPASYNPSSIAASKTSHALGLVGVLYPERLKSVDNTAASLEAANDLRWWLHGSRGASLAGRHIVRTGSVSELNDHLRTIPLELEGVDRVFAAAIAVEYALSKQQTESPTCPRVSPNR